MPVPPSEPLRRCAACDRPMHPGTQQGSVRTHARCAGHRRGSGWTTLAMRRLGFSVRYAFWHSPHLRPIEPWTGRPHAQIPANSATSRRLWLPGYKIW